MARPGEVSRPGGEGPVRPVPAPVVPRVRVAGAGAAALPLHARILAMLGEGPTPQTSAAHSNGNLSAGSHRETGRESSEARGVRGVVAVAGSPGSGKTVALEHLASVLQAKGLLHRVHLVDGGPFEWAETLGRNRLVVYACPAVPATSLLATFEMVPWSRDDCLEYLLAVCRGRCGSVLGRLEQSAAADAARGTCAVTADDLAGLPELWRVVLDEMAADESIAGPPDALRHFFAARLPDPVRRDAAMDLCLNHIREEQPAHVRGAAPTAFDPTRAEDLLRVEPFVRRLIRHRPVRVTLAAQKILWELCPDGPDYGGLAREALSWDLPEDLLRETASLVRHRPPAARRLEQLLEGPFSALQPMAASLLYAADRDWRPFVTMTPLRLTRARLDGARWSFVALIGAYLIGARLSGAVLSEADLEGASATGACFAGATLTGACLRRLRAPGADFSRASLAGADAEGAELVGSDFRDADLSAAILADARMSGADLSGAQLCGAVLKSAALGFVKFAGADLSGADLSGANLDNVCLKDCRLDGAIFRSAKLLKCDLEGIELRCGDFRGADLTGSYLTGSILSGADFSGANLRDTGLAEVKWDGADLSGADLTGASFHLGSTRCGLVGAPGTLPACEGSRTGFYTDDLADRDFKPPEEIRKADLRGVDLRGAKIENVDFYLVDLRGAKYTGRQGRHLRGCGAIL